MAGTVGFAKEIADVVARRQKKEWGHQGRDKFVAMSGVGSHTQLRDQVLNVGFRGQVAAKIYTFPRRDASGRPRADDMSHELHMKRLEEKDPHQHLYDRLGEYYESMHPVQHKRSRHIHLKYHFVRNQSQASW